MIEKGEEFTSQDIADSDACCGSFHFLKKEIAFQM